MRHVHERGSIAEFAHKNGFTQLLGPTHLLSSANDAWLRRDIEMMKIVRDELRRLHSNISLIYPLALPIQLLRDPVQREVIVSAISEAPCDAIWLRIENFGQYATGDKVASYIAACEDFRALGKPLVADCVSGLPGLGLLAFGAVGGLAHGITLFEIIQAELASTKTRNRTGGWSDNRATCRSWIC